MKVAVIGSRNLAVNDLEKYLPQGISEIVSGGAKGIDSCARKYAQSHNVKLTEFIPEYEKYGKSAPLKRNLQIIDYADMVVAFWDGVSRGTKYVIENCQQRNKPVKIMLHKNQQNHSDIFQSKTIAIQPKIE